ncbi:MAG: disulfide bond formation protein B [Zoogloeaceae bacterium]|nr:disulfide bond formation protein B [Zoogloeaceae bacterium]
MLAFLRRPRLPFATLALVCIGLISYGLYLQYGGHLEPCPLCILQRYAFSTVILVAIAATLHGPRRQRARLFYGGLLVIASVLGAGIAAWQSYIQRFPPDLAECGPSLSYMLESFPLSSSLPMIFRGAGDCTAIDWTFLGLSIANWSLAAFVLIALAAIVAMRQPAPRS